MSVSRRNFLKAASVLAGTTMMPSAIAQTTTAESQPDEGKADYTIRIAASPVEISPKKIISTTTYNGQFPGPLLRFKEGQRVTVDIFNDTDTPEQLHWHGQFVPSTWTAPPKKARRSSPRAASGASPLCRSLRAIASTTRTIALEPISPPANTADKLDLSTSSLSVSRVVTIARSSSS